MEYLDILIRVMMVVMIVFTYYKAMLLFNGKGDR